MTQAKFFKDHLWRNKVGAEGRKEVKLDFFESLKIPIPPITVQRKIATYWKNSEKERKATFKEISNLRAAAEECLLNALKIVVPSPEPLRGKLAKRWKEFERWDTFFYRKDFMELESQLSKLNAARIIDIARIRSRPWKRANFPSGKFRYVEISSVTKDKGITGFREVSLNNAPSRATTLIKEGDLIISTTRPYLGAFAIVDKRYDNCVCSSGFTLIDWINKKKLIRIFCCLSLKARQD